MVIVAVAGGTSRGLGWSIVTAFHEHPNHTPIVLSRMTSKTPQWLTDLPVEIRKVDYGSVDSLVSALQGVHTVISTTLNKEGSWVENESALLQAALQAGCRRFAPSEWSAGPAGVLCVDMLKPKSALWPLCERAAKEHPGFEWTRFAVGMFMNYLGYGCEREAEALNGMEDNGAKFVYVGEMRMEMAVREDGEPARITLTEIGDVGRFVAAACCLPDGKWTTEMGMAGETLRFDEIAKIIEKIRGREIEIEKRSPRLVEQELEEDLKNEDSGYWRRMWLQLELMDTHDVEGEGVIRPVLNEMFPDIKAITVEQYIKKFWE
ncbi:NAD(P)-binding protein [Eremomyces bilateralis CBS 781.70]|uniref:NAD(P)-binding protein n=1 Tax=Eremomyces bilateralis CBS 781.70 TaxID=1392243 RepID=A0A6G1FSW0_9PEZI|nr:NAD(P)-binding protein [Eremomyces bilateralis CBS 781.70]KAF1808843.1 NAD(P)-binding protein [Eremomyces bilateralis CBS 781.70]